MKHILNITTLAFSALSLVSCTKNFDDLNRDPTRPTTITPEALITSAEKSASDVMYNNFVNGRVGMLGSQYWSHSNGDGMYARYFLDEGTNNLLWSLYSSALTNLDEIIKMREADPEAVTANSAAIANILSVWIFQVLTDVYGNIPYSEALKGINNFTARYDDSRAIYDSLVARIDRQLPLLDPGLASFRSGEKIYNGDVTKWRKLANSLKLRIGIRMADAYPDVAKGIVESAIAGGVIDDNSSNALFPYLSAAPDQFPYSQLQGGSMLLDYKMSKTLVDFMGELSDPRLPKYARPADADGEYHGLTYGLANQPENVNNAFSYPGTRPYSPDFPGIIMTKAEVDFAMAEAAARGWAAGLTAAQHYENGIRASMAFWQVTDQQAIANYLDKVEYSQADWRNCIGTQKWLSLYMQGLQGWFERTRLEFNKPGRENDVLFATPVLILDNNIAQANLTVPYRLTYPVSEANINRTNYQQAGQAIGGDTKATKLWWNK